MSAANVIVVSYDDGTTGATGYVDNAWRTFEQLPHLNGITDTTPQYLPSAIPGWITSGTLSYTFSLAAGTYRFALRAMMGGGSTATPLRALARLVTLSGGETNLFSSGMTVSTPASNVAKFIRCPMFLRNEVTLGTTTDLIALQFKFSSTPTNASMGQGTTFGNTFGASRVLLRITLLN